MTYSIFDDDLYKFTMQQAVLRLYPDARVKCEFRNRGPQRFNEEILKSIKEKIDDLASLCTGTPELEKFAKLPFISPWYVDYLSNFRYNPKTLNIGLKEDGDLALSYSGHWYQEILWEVKLMSIISEAYFEFHGDEWSMDGQKEKLQLKTDKLASADCKYADFGTRRRRNYEIQDLVVSSFKNYYHFKGTSNVHLAFKHGVNPVGTMAHEWIQGISALQSLNHANRFMLQDWVSVYGQNLAIALTDTFGTDAFLRDFNYQYASLFAGTRHDSGDPYKYTDKMVNHYKSLNINPSTKEIVFSDNLNADTAVSLKHYCDNSEINCSFGIGTNFTNDFANSPALNMVIKLVEVNGQKVVKLSDVAGKANGDPKAVEMMRWLYNV